MKFRQIIASSFIVAAVFTSCSDDDDSSTPAGPDVELNAEVQLLLNSIEADGGTPFNFQDPALDFTPEQNVFVPSVLGIDYRITGNQTTSAQPTVTLPMFQGWETAPTGLREAYYVITEASDADFAEQLGVIYAPRMADAGAAGSQNVEWTEPDEDGVRRLIFPGYVDFSGERSLVGGEIPGEDSEDFGLLTFPPASTEYGAIA